MPTGRQINLQPGVLYDVMKDLDISRDELARRVGVDRATAYRIDEGMVCPSPKFMAGLMVLTGKKFEDLFRIEDAA